jgi:multiple sugar transport system permease protein
MMKKTGYPGEFAGAVEAAASTGGQIMPPIMGAAAFLMAEMVGVPYSQIVIKAILPAVLYFTGIFLMVHLRAKRLGLKGIPRELDEAATIDGCSKYAVYANIILPLLKPSIVTTVIIQFYWKWDDYMGPLLYLSKPESYTASLAIKMFADAASKTDYGAMFAMSTLSLIPVFVIFMIFNKRLVEGIGASGLKV